MTKMLISYFLTNLKLNRIVIIFFILIYHNFNVLAQFTGSNYQFPERFNSNYYFNPNLSYQKIKNIQVPGFTAEQMEYYKILKTYNTQKGFDNNSYYLEWNELEKYLYKLVDTILPFNIKDKQPFDVFIERGIDYNAHALGNGFIFANIGLIAECKTEAELAYVLSHEIGHSVFNHGYMINSDLISSFNQNDISATIINYNKMFEKSQAAELQSDSFAYQCINSVNYNLNAIKSSLDLLGYSEYVSQFYISKFQRSSYKEFLNKFSSHPSFNKRYKLLSKNISSTQKLGKNFIIDSVYFNKVKKFAHEECKKISMEEGDYQSTIKLSFIDYLGGDNSLKNLFYLFESTRRFLYANPENSKKGFLAEDLQFTEFENTNYSILKKPELLFVDSMAFVKCEKHILIENPEKPFNTYEEAFLFFSKIGEDKHFNESQFSRALFYYSKKDIENFNYFLGNYLEKGGGIYTDFANNLKINGFPYIKEGVTAVIIDNSTNFEESDNYFHSLYRIKDAETIKNAFKADSAKIKLTLMNDLLGIKPRELYMIQKLKWNISQLYTEKDAEVYYKKRYLRKDDIDEIERRSKFNKNLLLFVPEWYKWFAENKFNGVLIQNVNYKYAYVTEPNEYYNFYTLKYINLFEQRPYFGKCWRTATLRKQTPIEIATDARNYLFKIE